MKRLLVLGALALYVVSVAPEAPARSTQCQSTRAIFYSQSAWAQLVQGLDADPSSCAQYYISIPPPAAAKTTMRPNAAPVVDRLGPNFHAVAEVNYTAWANWVASTGNSWYQAGQAARAAMDEAGFNVAAGDTWAVNEFPSTVLSGAGGDRQNAEQLVQGLYAGSGSEPQAQGIVFMIGVSQRGVSYAQYKASLESWFQDQTFWSTMSADVSDFMFEAYGDFRDYAVAGEDPTTRATYLNNYLQAPLTLASAAGAPAQAAAARTFLSAAYGPLANASWAWSSKYGWTNVTSADMADYVSAQTYAMRSYPTDPRIGFAWNPNNSQGIDTADFNADAAGVLARLAGSIHETDAGNPQQACEATGCAASLVGAAPATGWGAFSSWTPTEAVFSSAAQTLTPSTASAVMSVQLQTGGVPTTLPNPSAVTLSSSSGTGVFASAPGGPWTPSLTLTVPAGAQGASFYTMDSTAGSPTLTSNLGGALATQVETVAAPASAPAPPPPPSAQVASVTFTPANDRMHAELRVVDGSGHPLQAQVRFGLLLGSSTVATTMGATSSAGFLGVTALPALERGCYRVAVQSVKATGYAWNGVSPSQSDCVTSLPMQVTGVALAPQGGRMHVALRVVTDAGQPLQARVRLALLVGSTPVAVTFGTTSPAGALGVTARPLLQRGCYRVDVQAVVASGYQWAGPSPTQSTCVTTLPAHLGPVVFALRHGRLHVALGVLDAAGAPVRARVALAVLHAGAPFAATTGATGSDGRLGLTAAGTLATGCYAVRVSSVSAKGFAWDGVEPGGRYCLRAVPKPPRARHGRSR